MSFQLEDQHMPTQVSQQGQPTILAAIFSSLNYPFTITTAVWERANGHRLLLQTLRQVQNLKKMQKKEGNRKQFSDHFIYQNGQMQKKSFIPLSISFVSEFPCPWYSLVVMYQYIMGMHCMYHVLIHIIISTLCYKVIRQRTPWFLLSTSYCISLESAYNVTLLSTIHFLQLHAFSKKDGFLSHSFF